MFNLFKDPRREHFKNKLKAVEKSIWDLEFKRFKVREIREEVRAEYDNKKSKLAALEREMVEQKEGVISKEEREEMEKNKAILTEDINRHMQQMADLDTDIVGAPATEQSPGKPGINLELDSYRELAEMLRIYINQEL
jgi:chromosome segregation ATPase